MPKSGESDEESKPVKRELIIQDDEGAFYRLTQETLDAARMSDEEAEQFVRTNVASGGLGIGGAVQGPSALTRAVPSGFVRVTPTPSHFVRVVPSHFVRVVPAPSHFVRAVPSHFVRVVPSHLVRAVPSHLVRAAPSGLDRVAPSGLARAVPAGTGPAVVRSWKRGT